MPLRPRFGPLGGSDVVDALLCSSPRAQTPEAWSPCGTPLHGRIDLSRRLTDVTTLAFLHAQRESERFADPQPGAPQQHDQRPESVAVGAVTDGAHHGDDLLHRRRVGGVLLALVAWWAPSVVAGHGRRVSGGGRRTSSSTDSMNPP